MKASKTWLRFGLVAGLWLGPGLCGLSAREYYQDKEAWGTLLRVEDYPKRKVIKVDRGPEKGTMVFQWSRNTRFLENGKRVPLSSLREGQRVRVYYSDDAKRTGVKRPVANKVVVNPVSSPQDRRYNQ